MVEHDDQIGLYDVPFGQLHVARCVEHHAQSAQLDLRIQLKLDAARKCLVIQIGGRVHDVLSIDDLVPAPIIGNESVLGIAQLSLRVRFH